MATTYTATATSGSWQIIATSTNGVTTYTLKSSTGTSWNLGSNPASAIKVDSSLTDFNKKLFDGGAGYTGLSINGKKNEIVASDAAISSLLASIPQMVQQTNAEIKAQQTSTTTAATTTRTPVDYKAPPPIDSSLEGSPDYQASVSAPPPVPASVVAAEQQLDGKPLSTPTTTTNPSNHLPMGNEIDDIYDPNLTPEQVASLSPGDQYARAQELGYEYKGPAVTPGEVDPNTGEIIVTAPGPGNPVPPSPLSQYDDWRVRLSLAPEANYLYRADDPGILAPLLETNGVIFPYTPTISVNYAANYEQSTIIHSNYKVYQYSNSSVDNITITCDFTAQDTREANYLLAVIHFFRSVTKMFFGQDESPRAGTPPPLCYLTGMGNYQFSEHPMAITGFTYNLPNDVDYIKTVGPSISGLLLPAAPIPTGRLPDNILPGGRPAPPDFTKLSVSPAEENTVSWVPTKIQLSITGVPIISRNQMSQQFSLKDYATGALLNVRNSSDGGFW